MSALDWIHNHSRLRRQAGLKRAITARPWDGTVMDLAGNDYLGLARDPQVVEAAVAATRRWGVGSTGSRIVTGTTDLHQELEATLASFVGTEAAVVFSSGYMANIGAVTSLAPDGTHIVSDRLNHASLIDAIRLTRRPTQIYTHASHVAAGHGLAAVAPSPALLVTDALFSVDGDLAPLEQLHALAAAHPAAVIVDEAHTLGVMGTRGQGLAASMGLQGDGDVVLTATLSKALGSQGGVVLGSRDVVEHVLDSSRTFLFDTGLNPSAVGGALAALRLIAAEPERVNALRMRARQIHEALVEVGFSPSEPHGAVQSVAMPTPHVAVAVQKWFLTRGIHVGCFRPPSVPDGISRLRFTARADLSDTDIDRLRKALHAVCTEFPMGSTLPLLSSSMR